MHPSFIRKKMLYWQDAENPEELYIKKVMPAKLKLNMRYINEMSLATDIKVILKTIWKDS